LEKNEDLLKKIYLFSKFSENELHTLASKAKKITVPQGHTIFNEGNSANSLYLIISGTLKVTTSATDGDDIKITTLSNGEHLGEFPFIDAEKRSATVEAIEKTDLLELTYDDLRYLLINNKDMELKFYKELATFLVGRVRVLTNDITKAREIKKRFT
jgi:CRP-like cAMP-binding protein